jgi:hypothetical protein
MPRCHSNHREPMDSDLPIGALFERTERRLSTTGEFRRQGRVKIVSYRGEPVLEPDRLRDNG